MSEPTGPSIHERVVSPRGRRQYHFDGTKTCSLRSAELWVRIGLPEEGESLEKKTAASILAGKIKPNNTATIGKATIGCCLKRAQTFLLSNQGQTCRGADIFTLPPVADVDITIRSATGPGPEL